MSDSRLDLSHFLRDVVDFPKPGVVFKDITPLLGDHSAFTDAVNQLAEPYRDAKITHVVGIEARGFIVAAPVALALGAGFVPVRKPGKLPFTIERETYALEYGTDTLEIHADAFASGSQPARVLIVDDVLATGGTAKAAVDLVRRLGVEVVGTSFLIELTFLSGRGTLGAVPIHSLIEVAGN